MSVTACGRSLGLLRGVCWRESGHTGPCAPPVRRPSLVKPKNVLRGIFSFGMMAFAGVFCADLLEAYDPTLYDPIAPLLVGFALLAGAWLALDWILE